MSVTREHPLVRIIRPWKNPDWLRQTPESSGLWGNVQFTEKPIDNPDFVIVCNHAEEDIALQIDPCRVWLLLQEPPIREYRWLRAGYVDFGRIIGPDPTLRGKPDHLWQQGCLPWHVGRTYGQLKTELPPSKSVDLTWITSNDRRFSGHQQRMCFLERLQSSGVPLALYGRGFKAIEDKWDALAPARYALAIENFSGSHYWTEKVSDCFLALTMPIYWGCTNLADYFPEESFVWIDIKDRNAPKRVAEILRSNLAETRRESILEARRRVLEEHQFFACMSRRVQEQLAERPEVVTADHVIRRVTDLTLYYSSTPRWRQAWNGLRRRLIPELF
jgi:hypothetical protein